MRILKKKLLLFFNLAHSFYILGKADKNYISAKKNNCFAVEIIILLQKKNSSVPLKPDILHSRFGLSFSVQTDYTTVITRSAHLFLSRIAL